MLLSLGARDIHRQLSYGSCHCLHGSTFGCLLVFRRMKVVSVDGTSTCLLPKRLELRSFLETALQQPSSRRPRKEGGVVDKLIFDTVHIFAHSASTAPQRRLLCSYDSQLPLKPLRASILPLVAEVCSPMGVRWRGGVVVCTTTPHTSSLIRSFCRRWQAQNAHV